MRSVFLNWSESYQLGPDNDTMSKIEVLTIYFIKCTILPFDDPRPSVT